MQAFPADAHRRGGAASAPIHREAAQRFYAPLIPLVVELHGRGLSLRKIAAELNRLGVSTRNFGPVHWSATQVSRVLARAAELSQA